MKKYPTRILLVTGVSGAGKSTVLRTLEDAGWEVVDNLPLTLLDHLLSAPPPMGAGEERRPLAIGIDSRTRGFNAQRLVEQIRRNRPVRQKLSGRMPAVHDLAQRTHRAPSQWESRGVPRSASSAVTRLRSVTGVPK